MRGAQMYAKTHLLQALHTRECLRQKENTESRRDRHRTEKTETGREIDRTGKI